MTPEEKDVKQIKSKRELRYTLILNVLVTITALIATVSLIMQILDNLNIMEKEGTFNSTLNIVFWISFVITLITMLSKDKFITKEE